AGLAGRSLGPGSRPGRARPRPGHNPVTDRAWSAGAVIGDVAGDGGAIEGQQAAVLDPAPDPDGGVAAGDGQPSHRSGHAVLLLVRPAPLPGWSRTDAPRRSLPCPPADAVPGYAIARTLPPRRAPNGLPAPFRCFLRLERNTRIL